jgi:hypothetical protein
MILDVVKLAIGAGTHIMKNRQQRKMLESDAAMLHAQKMANGEVEYQAAVRQSNDKGWKDEFVLDSRERTRDSFDMVCILG